MKLVESDIKQIAIDQLHSLGWEYLHGLARASEAEKAERQSFEQIILTERLRKATSVINSHIPKEAQVQNCYCSKASRVVCG